ncbi:CBS domain protein [Natronomonas pharaonis DSM 2160]|uniref:CBS domain protein n=1 Tax=Natronomonas pharaonis (strain ATCC 35678 / DSM 2160 / CIP 103997 / JCM 8858 / NBRC 14720 / NCIMB 2260 / Gabara) TaxID=348780 RepID=A0A1U7EYF9_NATPD|nr:CBS domain-containing protein [Natronomonas pharaonis]CAI50256.1 CBS domain protein [Natronomonas pharaonis DSM 2160]
MAEHDTNVESLMTSPVETIAPDASLADAATRLTEQSIGSLVVGEGQLRGIITESDIVTAVSEELDPETPVTELMSDPVVTIRRTETLQAAAERMGHNGVKKLPVVEGGSAIGIITTTDLALHLPNYQVNMAHQAEPDIVDGEWE